MNNLLGKQFGCHDQAPPELNTPEQLSKIHDLLQVAETVGGKILKKQVFNLLDNATKLEFNYSNWRYC